MAQRQRLRLTRVGFLKSCLPIFPFRNPSNEGVEERPQMDRGLSACDVEDGCECNLFKLDWLALPMREPAPPKCCSTDRRTSGRHAVGTAVASPARLVVPLAWHLSRRLAKAGFARKAQDKVCQTPNSSRRFYDLSSVASFKTDQSEMEAQRTTTSGVLSRFAGFVTWLFAVFGSIAAFNLIVGVFGLVLAIAALVVFVIFAIFVNSRTQPEGKEPHA